MITCTIPFKRFNFPVGEGHIQLEFRTASPVDVLWNNPVEVANFYKVTEFELKKMTASASFKLI